MDTDDLESLVTRCNQLKIFRESCMDMNEAKLSLTNGVLTNEIDGCDTSIMLSDIRKIIEDRIDEVEKQIKMVVNG